MAGSRAIDVDHPVSRYYEAEDAVRLDRLFDAVSWTIVGSDESAVARGEAALEGSPAQLRSFLIGEPGLGFELHHLGPRHPLLLSVAQWEVVPSAWLLVLEALRVHHGSLAVLLPDGGTPPAAARDLTRQRSARALTVRVGESAGVAVIFRHVRTALDGPTRRASNGVPRLHRFLATGDLSEGLRAPLTHPFRRGEFDVLVSEHPELQQRTHDPLPVVRYDAAGDEPERTRRMVTGLGLVGALPVVEGRDPADLGLPDTVLSILQSIDRAASMPETDLARRSVELRRLLAADTPPAIASAGTDVSVLLVSRRPAMVGSALRQIATQTHARREVVLVGHGWLPGAEVGDLLPDHVGLVTRTVPEDATLGDGLNLALGLAGGDVVVKLDDDDLYGEHLITDLVRALHATGATLVGSAMDFVYLRSLDRLVQRGATAEAFGAHVSGATLTIERAVLRELGGWARVPRAVDTRLLDGIRRAGGTHYAIHGFGYVTNRHGQDNTFAASDAWFLSQSRAQWPGKELAVAGVAALLREGGPGPGGWT